MNQIIWLPEAREDMNRLYDFIFPYNEEAAGNALLAIHDAIVQLQSMPELGRPWQEDAKYRELPVKFGVKGYLVRYRLLDETIYIFRIWHGLEDRDTFG